MCSDTCTTVRAEFDSHPDFILLLNGVPMEDIVNDGLLNSAEPFLQLDSGDNITVLLDPALYCDARLDAASFDIQSIHFACMEPYYDEI